MIERLRLRALTLAWIARVDVGLVSSTFTGHGCSMFRFDTSGNLGAALGRERDLERDLERRIELGRRNR